jgi:hypothetical protein
MGDVIRLPVSHKQYPECPRCGSELTTFPGMDLSFRPTNVVRILSVTVTIHAVCASCNTRLDLVKKCTEE